MRKKCWQREIRESFAAQWHIDFDEDIDISKASAIVEQIDFNTCKRIILKYEWLGSMPAGAFLCAALKFKGRIAAVEVFTETKPGGKITLFNQPATLLARGCCVYWAPPFASSYLISQSLKIIEKHYKGVPRFIMAYSDWDAGELGTVYQASNWTYLGHKSKPEWRDPQGNRYDPAHHRDLAKSRDREFKKKKLLNPIIVQSIKEDLERHGWKMAKTSRGSYATVIGYKSPEKKSLIAELNKHAVPYPKSNIIDNVEIVAPSVEGMG